MVSLEFVKWSMDQDMAVVIPAMLLCKGKELIEEFFKIGSQNTNNASGSFVSKFHPIRTSRKLNTFIISS